MRPKSVVTFEWLFLASIALSSIVGIMSLPLRAALVDRMTGSDAGASVLWAWLAIILVVNLAVWWFTARRRNTVARWAGLLIAAISAALLLIGLVSLFSRTADPLRNWSMVSLVAHALCIAAVIALFRPDARAWFEEGVA